MNMQQAMVRLEQYERDLAEWRADAAILEGKQQRIALLDDDAAISEGLALLDELQTLAVRKRALETMAASLMQIAGARREELEIQQRAQTEAYVNEQLTIIDAKVERKLAEEAAHAKYWMWRPTFSTPSWQQIFLYNGLAFILAAICNYYYYILFPGSLSLLGFVAISFCAPSIAWAIYEQVIRSWPTRILLFGLYLILAVFLYRLVGGPIFNTTAIVIGSTAVMGCYRTVFYFVRLVFWICF